MNNHRVNYAYIVTIVHGKSEYKIVEYVYQTIRQSNKNIYAKRSGKNFSSIQINGLEKLLQSYPFNSINNFITHFSNIEVENKKIKNLKIAIIMDTDDCSHQTKEKFLDKSLFINHPLYEYIMPIHNTENLEDVFRKCSIKIPNSKREDYSKIFPQRGITSLEAINQVNKKLKSKPQATNMPEFFDYCLKNKYN